MSINTIRPIISLDSRIGETPKEWLRDIEKFLVRGPWLPCWLWVGTYDAQGYPLLLHPETKKYTSATRYVAKMFWSFPDTHIVSHACPNRNCMNPAHFAVVPRGATTKKKEK